MIMVKGWYIYIMGYCIELKWVYEEFFMWESVLVLSEKIGLKFYSLILIR